MAGLISLLSLIPRVVTQTVPGKGNKQPSNAEEPKSSGNAQKPATIEQTEGPVVINPSFPINSAINKIDTIQSKESKKVLQRNVMDIMVGDAVYGFFDESEGALAIFEGNVKTLAYKDQISRNLIRGGSPALNSGNINDAMTSYITSKIDEKVTAKDYAGLIELAQKLGVVGVSKEVLNEEKAKVLAAKCGERLASLSEQQKEALAIDLLSQEKGALSKEEISSRIKLIEAKKLEYRRLNKEELTGQRLGGNIDTKFAGYKIFYFERGSINNNITVYTLKDKSTDEIKDYFKFLKKMFVLYDPSDDLKFLTYEYISDQAGGVIDQNLFKRLLPTAKKREETLIKLGLLDKTDKNKPSTANYYMPAGTLYSEIVAGNKMGQVDGTVYVQDEGSLQDPDVQKLIKAGIKVEVNKSLSFSRLNSNNPDIVYVKIKTDVSDNNDFNLRKMSQVVNKVLFSKGDVYRDTQYMSLDSYIMLTNENVVGTALAENIKKFKAASVDNLGGLELNALSGLDNLTIDRERLLSSQAALESGMRNKEYIAMLRSGDVNAYLTYSQDKIKGKDQVKSIKIVVVDNSDPKYPDRHVYDCMSVDADGKVKAVNWGTEEKSPALDIARGIWEGINELLAKNGVPLGSPEAVVSVLKNLSDSKAGIIGRDLSVNRLSGDEMIDNAINIQLGRNSLDDLPELKEGRVIPEMVFEAVNLIMVKSQDKDGKITYRTPEECKKIVDVVTKILDKPAADRKAFINDITSSKSAEQINPDFRNILLSLKDNNLIDLALNAFLACNGFTPKEVEAFKATTGLLNKGVKPSELRFMILKSKSALVPVTPNLIGALENGALDGNNKNVHYLDEVIFKSPAGQYLSKDRSHWVLKTFDLPEQKDKFGYLEALIGFYEYQASNGDIGQAEAKESASRLRKFFFEGSQAKKSDIESFLRYLYSFDPQEGADTKVMQDKKDIALKKADNFKPFNFEYNISSVKVASDDKLRTFSVFLGNKDENLEAAGAGKSVTSATVDTLELYGKGKYSELVWLNLAVAGSKGSPADAFNGKSVIYDPATFKTVSYIDSTAVEKVIEIYGKKRLSDQNPSLPYIHFLIDLDVITAAEMLDYKDAQGNPVFAKGTRWYSLLSKIQLGQDSAGRVSLEDVKFGEKSAAEYLRSPAGIAELEARLRAVKGLSADEYALARGMLLDVTNKKIYYADVAGLTNSEVQALERFDQHLKANDFGTLRITDKDITRGEDMTEEEFYSMLSERGRAPKDAQGKTIDYDKLDKKQRSDVTLLFLNYKQGIDIFSRIALTQAMTLEITPDDRKAAGAKGKSWYYRYGVDVPKRLVVATFKDSFSAVKTTMRPPEDIRGMGTDVLVSFAIKSKLFPEMFKRSHSNLLSYSILSAFCDASKSDGIHYDILSEKLAEIVKYNESAPMEAGLQALLQSVNSKDTGKIKEAIRPFFADQKVFDGVLGKQEIKGDDLKPLWIEMIKHQRLYRVDMDYLVSERWDLPALEALRNAIRGKNDEKKVNWAFADFVAEAMGLQLLNPLTGSLSPFNKLADELDVFLKDHDSINWNGLNPSLEVSDGSHPNLKAEIGLKQHIAQYIAMIPPSKLKEVPGESDLALNSIRQYPRSITSLVAPANVGIYQKYIKISNEGGVEGLESAFSIARLGYDTNKWNVMTTDELRGVLGDTRAAYEKLGYKNILRSLSHGTIAGLMKDDKKAKDKSLVLNVTGSKVFVDLFPVQDIIYEMMTHDEIDFVFNDEAAQNKFHRLSALSGADQKKEITEMVKDGNIRLNPSSTVKFNPWNKEYGILADKDAQDSDDTLVNKMYVWLDNLDKKGKRSVDLQIFTQKGSVDQTVVKGLEYVHGLDQDEGRVIRGMNDLLDGEFSLYFPSDKQVYSEKTNILTIDEMEEKAVVISAMQNCKDPATVRLLANGAMQVVDMLLSPANGKDLKKIWNGNGGREKWADEVSKEMAKQFEGMGIAKEIFEPLLKVITFRLKYGVFMHLNVAYGIPFQIAAQDISTPEGISKAVALSMIPLFIFPRWASIWYTDAWNKAFKEGDWKGGLLEFWMVNTMTARRAGMPGMVDMQLMTMNGMWRGGRTALRGAWEFAGKPVLNPVLKKMPGLNKVVADMDYSFSLEGARFNTFKKGWFDPTIFENIQGSRSFNRFVSNKYVSWAGRWALKGPFAELAGRLGEISPRASQWHSPQNLAAEGIAKWARRKPLGSRTTIHVLANTMSNPISLPGQVIKGVARPVVRLGAFVGGKVLGVEQEAKQVVQAMLQNSYQQKKQEIVDDWLKENNSKMKEDPFKEILDPSRSPREIAEKIADAELMGKDAALQNKYNQTQQEYEGKILRAANKAEAKQLTKEGNIELGEIAKDMEKAEGSRHSEKKRLIKDKTGQIEVLRKKFGAGNVGTENIWQTLGQEVKGNFVADVRAGLSSLSTGEIDYLGMRGTKYALEGPRSALLNNKLAKKLLAELGGDKGLLEKYSAYKDAEMELANTSEGAMQPEQIQAAINEEAKRQKIELQITDEDLQKIVKADNQIKGAIDKEINDYIGMRKSSFDRVLGLSADQAKLASAGNNLLGAALKSDIPIVPEAEVPAKRAPIIGAEPAPAYLGLSNEPAGLIEISRDNGTRIVKCKGVEMRISEDLSTLLRKDPVRMKQFNQLIGTLKVTDQVGTRRAKNALSISNNGNRALTAGEIESLNRVAEIIVEKGFNSNVVTGALAKDIFPKVGGKAAPAKAPYNPMAAENTGKFTTTKPSDLNKPPLKLVEAEPATKPVMVDVNVNRKLLEISNAQPNPEPKTPSKAEVPQPNSVIKIEKPETPKVVKTPFLKAPGEIKVLGQTLGAIGVTLAIEVPVDVISQWKENGVIDVEETLKNAGKTAGFVGVISGGQYVAVKIGARQSGVVKILFVLPATMEIMQNPGKIGQIGTGAALNYVSFEAGMRAAGAIGLPGWLKLAGGVLMAMGENKLYDQMVQKTWVGKALDSPVGKGIGIASWAWLAWDALRFARAHPVVSVITGLIIPTNRGGREDNGPVITGGVYEMAMLGQDKNSGMTSLRLSDKEPLNYRRPDFKGIKLEDIGLVASKGTFPGMGAEKMEWGLKDMASDGDGRLHFETFLYLYKLGHIKKTAVVGLGGKELMSKLDAVDFKDAKTYQAAFWAWDEALKNCDRQKEEVVLVNAIRTFKSDINTMLGKESGEKVEIDGAPDIYGKQTAFWMMYLLDSKVKQEESIKSGQKLVIKEPGVSVLE